MDDDIPFEIRGRGRPPKNVPGRNIKVLTLAELGLTRRKAFELRRLGEVPKEEVDAMLALPPAERTAALRHVTSGRWRRGLSVSEVVAILLTKAVGSQEE